MLFSSRNIFLVVAPIFFLAACAPGEIVAPGDPWRFGDLRLLSPGDLEEAPELDLIAAYTRFAGSDWQIRLDLLEMTDTASFDLTIALDVSPGGIRQLPGGGNTDINWDYLLILPGSGSPFLIQAPGSEQIQAAKDLDNLKELAQRSIPRVSRLPWLDSVVISLNRHALPITGRGIGIQAFTVRPGSLEISDVIGPFHSTDSPPSKAPLLLAFWNTFPAYSPAQSIRRWDGAHTGPFGERHGLSVLLHAVRRFHVPVTLLDLKNPASISALDYLGVLPFVRELAEDKLIILPDPVPGSPSYPLFPDGLPDWAVSRALEDVRTAARAFDLPASAILYSPNRAIAQKSQYSYTFTRFDDQSVSDFGSSRLFPIPFEKSLEPQADESGLSLEVRKILLENALSRSNQGDQIPLLILGGSLPESPFGDPEIASASLNYIAGHPWIDPLTIDELTAATLPGFQPQVMSGINYVPNLAAFLPSPNLSTLTEPGNNQTNPLLQAAWQAALTLYNPLPPEPFDLPALRSVYSSQVVVLSRAALWAENRMPMNTCSTDPDRDNVPECVLASEYVFTLYGIDGGRLLSMFVADEFGVHQVIAPTTQFAIGQTDPSIWDLTFGEGAEKNAIHGAFADSQPPWEWYYPTSESDWINFSHAQAKLEKTFTLINNGLRVDYRTQEPITVQIPIALDPWNRFTPDWGEKYHGEEIADGYKWEWDSGPAIVIRSNARIRTMPFTASRPYLGSPENPNFPYPRGHYSPFPVLIVELRSAREFYVEITLNSPQQEPP